LHIVANARHFGHPLFAALYAELRGFAAKISQAVENDRETTASTLRGIVLKPFL
jgi:hypothetical protein